MIKQKYIYGIHPLREALLAQQTIDRIYLRRAMQSSEIKEIRQLAEKAKVPVLEVPVEKLNRLTRGTHQGCVALVSPIAYTELDWLLPAIFEQGRDPLLVILDGIQDTRNFGAIARSAECAGADAIVIPARHSVSVTADAVNASAGALLRIPVCRTDNIAQTIEQLAHSGLKIVIASEKAQEIYYEASLSGPLALVMGNEHTGVASHTRSLATNEIAIPQYGAIGSLNVSVAAGILLFEIARQRTS